MLPILSSNPKTERQVEQSTPFVDWAEKVKTDVISKAISDIVQDANTALGQSVFDRESATTFENGGTGDAISSGKSAKNQRSRALNSQKTSINTMSRHNENRPPSSQKNSTNFSEKGRPRITPQSHYEKPDFRIKKQSSSN